jgi:glucose/arabinose dehydrogenase
MTKSLPHSTSGFANRQFHWLFNNRIAAVLFFVLLSIALMPSARAALPAGFSQVLVSGSIPSPTTMAFAPDGRIFVAQQTGQLRVIKNGVLLSQPFVTLSVSSSGERGLLGIAFDPNFSSNHFIYLYYTRSNAANNRISRFTASGDTVVPGSEVVVLDLDPLSGATNHNAGNIKFGLDGKLYVCVGENADSAKAQNLDTYMGKILRINSDGSAPGDNPFPTGSAQRMRIWEYGMRNPFTMAIQPGTGKIFVDDVGEHTWEEINDCSVGGLNFGWARAEGISGNPLYTNPVYTYGHGSGTGIGCAITGGTFFNPVNTNYPSTYIGNYFFLDVCGTWIDMLTPNGGTWTRSNFGTGIAGSPVCITTGPDGALYFLSRDNSSLYKIAYTSTTTGNTLADSYTQSGTFANTNYGSNIVLQAKKAGTASNNSKMIYLRFNIASLGSTVTNATLRLYGSVGNSSSLNVDVFYVPDNTWGESTITFNNKPASSGTSYATKTITGTTQQYYEWNITSLVQQRRTAGSTMVSMVLKCAAKGSFVKFNSKEAASNMPQLVVTSSTRVSDDNDNASADDMSSMVTLYPNPAKNYFTVERKDNLGEATLRMFSTDGKLVREMNILPDARQDITISDLKKGLYLITIENEKGIIRKKLMIE